MAEFVTLDDTIADRVATIRIDRPPMNAINAQVVAELDAVADELAGRTDLAAAVLWGGPKIFAAGADVKEFAAFGEPEARELSTRLNATFAKVAALPQVVVAAVNGFALGGGCELAMCADFRLAGDDARFGQPEILLGILPGAGGTQRLARLVGVTVAKDLVYTGRQVKPDEAAAIGLVSSVHPADKVYDVAVEMAVGLAKGPAALRMAKAAVDDGFGRPLEDALAVEVDQFARSFATADARAGIGSFLEHGPGKAAFSGN